MNFGLPPRFGAQLRSKLREPSARCLPQHRAVLPSPPPLLNCLWRAELIPLLCGRAGTWGQSGKLGRVLLCWISWQTGASPQGRWLLLVGRAGCCPGSRALAAGSSSAAGLDGSQRPPQGKCEEGRVTLEHSEGHNQTVPGYVEKTRLDAGAQCLGPWPETAEVGGCREQGWLGWGFCPAWGGQDCFCLSIFVL